MINSKDFTKRLLEIMDFYNLSASNLADKIGVQRSSISHILSARNKPSLEFVMKLLSSFPEVDLYWLLNGKGQLSSEKTKQTLDEPINSVSRKSPNSKDIERVVIFFKDGSFENYQNYVFV